MILFRRKSIQEQACIRLAKIVKATKDRLEANKVGRDERGRFVRRAQA